MVNLSITTAASVSLYLGADQEKNKKNLHPVGTSLMGYVMCPRICFDFIFIFLFQVLCPVHWKLYFRQRNIFYCRTWGLQIKSTL